MSKDEETPVEKLFALGLPPVCVAEAVGVSRQAARKWKSGQGKPRPRQQVKAQAYLQELQAKSF